MPYRKTFELDPNFPRARRADALKLIRKLETLAAEQHVSDYDMALAFMGANDTQPQRRHLPSWSETQVPESFSSPASSY